MICSLVDWSTTTTHRFLQEGLINLHDWKLQGGRFFSVFFAAAFAKERSIEEEDGEDIQVRSSQGRFDIPKGRGGEEKVRFF